MKAKEIILLVLIIAAGVIFYHAHTGKLDWSVDFGDGIYWGLEEFIYEETQEIVPPFPAQLLLINSHGDIEIQGTEEQKITIDFQERIWRKNEEQAAEVAEKLKMTIDKSDNQFKISTNRDEFRKKKFETDFKVSIPKGMNIEVENSYGHVKASKVGNTKITNSYGEIILFGIEGKVDVINKYEDVNIDGAQADCQVESNSSTILAKNIKGGMKIIHKYGKIYLENISRRVEIESPYTEIYGYGLKEGVEAQNSYEKITLHYVGPTLINGKSSKIEIDGVEGDLRINDSYGKLKLNNIAGSLYIEGKSVEVSGTKIIGKNISISTSYKDIELADFSAKTAIQNYNGDIILDPTLLSQSLEARSEYGTIKFFWPKGKKYPFEARAKGGEINWNLPEEISFSEENGTKIIKAFLEETDKPSVLLSTRYGRIVVEE
ncbi:MAG: hypothetical protein GTO17_11670 [Candidatus Aminicenantes bacterium]|nr:hypothetical protein [Candidatus Aminicenantes bacterium]